ncbi:hypothetical protein MO867_19095 [Microbulbifer sp. OS29]|uniref:Uncharacterized protein n=1 Tax=Microbulbifer okhotskensis TaxID=2926617 RepID=A0A9X2EV20_9GAMM|nr:hypothetical protein [Microbulbifer okhotskensis]MCO1336443.1 hypothetical protein [Microbulbifer okhotskensis]
MELLSLKIPAGWEMIKNHFYDIVHENHSNPGELLGYPFHEDILFLRNRHLRRSVDLGWTPDCDPNGSYKLTLLAWLDGELTTPSPKQTILRKMECVTLKYKLTLPITEDWNNPIEKFESNCRFSIRDRINDFLRGK